ncbi:MAG: flagellar type III secretion system protein FliR [Alphaproteobacteria bacterium]|nr:flagellar type III secretion system protein FliR [Alphaproteobacteria bacterium]
MLEELLASEVFQFIIVFIRLGAAMMFMPGYSSAYVPARVRLSIAVAIALLITPVIGGNLPSPPDSAIILTLLIAKEITIGIFFGMMLQYVLAALDLAGNQIGLGLGLNMANAFDPMFNSNSPIVATFFSTIIVVLLFITNMHHLMVAAIIDSYQVFTPGDTLPNHDMLKYSVSTIGKSFIIGFKLSAPFFVFSILFQLALGLMSRLMPQLNIFFVSLPLKLYLGFYLLIMTIAIVLGWTLKYFEDSLVAFTSFG